MRKLLVGILTSTITMSAMATTIGVSSHPFVVNKKVITTELDTYLSNGTGTGITAKFQQRVNSKLTFDTGFGITDGERSSRFLAGADYQLLPDYGRQPKLSLKGLLDSKNMDGDRVNSFGVAPTLSKGLAFWGNEAFPFIALPVGVSLNTGDNSYQTTIAIAAGITGRIPVGGLENLVGNIETNISLKDSYAALVMGVSLPIQ